MSGMDYAPSDAALGHFRRAAQRVRELEAAGYSFPDPEEGQAMSIIEDMRTWPDGRHPSLAEWEQFAREAAALIDESVDNAVILGARALARNFGVSPDDVQTEREGDTLRFTVTLPDR